MSEKPLGDVDTSYDEKVAISNEHDEKIPSSRDAEAVGRKAVALNIVENPLQVRLASLNAPHQNYITPMCEWDKPRK